MSAIRPETVEADGTGRENVAVDSLPSNRDGNGHNAVASPTTEEHE